jgi:pimeloyl-ACP methyl ester carboxylesterase
MPVLRRDGVDLAYESEGSGPAILLIQGAGTIGETWRPQVAALEQTFTCITFDNRGTGGSGLPTGELTIEAMAGDALALMEALRIERFHVAGHSMGGLIAQQVALQARARVASLTLLCTFAHGWQASRLTPAMFLTAMRMRIGTRPMRRNAFMELVMPAGYLRQVDRAQLASHLAPLFGRDLADQPPVVMKQVRAMSRYDAGPQLGSLAGIPTLVLSATEDRIAAPQYGRELAHLIPGARYIQIEHAGHGVTIQLAGKVNEPFIAHLRAAEAPSAGQEQQLAVQLVP